VAGEETSRGLFAALKEFGPLKGKKVLFPRSSLSNPFLRDQLLKEGATVEELTVYRNTKSPLRKFPQDRIDSVLFTSPSTVKNFLADFGSVPTQWEILCKGPLTQKALKEAGYESEIVVV